MFGSDEIKLDDLQLYDIIVVRDSIYHYVYKIKCIDNHKIWVECPDGTELGYYKEYLRKTSVYLIKNENN